MKIFQGQTDGGCGDTDEVLILFNHKEIANIIDVLRQLAGGEYARQVTEKRPALTPKQLKAKSLKAMKSLADVCCYPT